MDNKRQIVMIVVVVGMLLLLLLSTGFIINSAKSNASKQVAPTVVPEAGANGEKSLYLDLPQDFPRDFPLYTKSKVANAESTNDLWSAVMLTSATVAEARDFYEIELPKKGWEITDTSQAAGLTIFSVTREPNSAIVTVGKGEDGTTISVTILK